MSRRNEVIERKTCLVLHLGISGRRKKEEDIDEENLHGTILLLTVNIFARLERMSKPSSDSSSSLLLVYLNESYKILWFYVTTISFLGVLLLPTCQQTLVYNESKCIFNVVQVWYKYIPTMTGKDQGQVPFMMETYEILTNRTSLYDRKAQTDCRQTYERQILLCPRKVEAKFRHGAEVHTIMQSGIQRKQEQALQHQQQQFSNININIIGRWWGVRRQGIPAAYTRQKCFVKMFALTES